MRSLTVSRIYARGDIFARYLEYIESGQPKRTYLIFCLREAAKAQTKEQTFRKATQDCSRDHSKDNPTEINNQVTGFDGLRENTANQSANTTRFFRLVQRSPELPETSEDRCSEATDQKQREKLDWFNTSEDD